MTRLCFGLGFLEEEEEEEEVVHTSLFGLRQGAQTSNWETVKLQSESRL